MDSNADIRNEYPRNRAKSHFAHRFVRLLTKSAAAQTLGPEVTWLLAVIAHQEDAKRYTSAVTFWNEQLMPLCGFRSKGRLVRARKVAVEEGWLHYEAGGKGTPGRYWTMIPPNYECLTDGPCDESLPVQNRTANGPHSKPQVDGKRSPSIPHPSPSEEEEEESPILLKKSKRLRQDTLNLPVLPEGVWDPEVSSAGLNGRLAPYWHTNRQTFAAAGIQLERFLGSVLAARARARSRPERYFQKCIRDPELDQRWVDEGKALMRETKRS